VEHIGYCLWEGVTFLAILSVATGLLVLRRKTRGRPAFTAHDRELFFGHPAVKRSDTNTKFYFHFAIAVLLSYFAGTVEYIVLGSLGASILATAELLTLLGIVKRWLC
jgi:hypothetical protein